MEDRNSSIGAPVEVHPRALGYSRGKSRLVPGGFYTSGWIWDPV